METLSEFCIYCVCVCVRESGEMFSIVLCNCVGMQLMQAIFFQCSKQFSFVEANTVLFKTSNIVHRTVVGVVILDKSCNNHITCPK